MPTVAEIEAMDRAALIAAWSNIFKSDAPKGLSQPILRRFLAFEVQAKRGGGLPKAVVETLMMPHMRRPTARLTPGGRLLREWNGVTHIVEVTPDGYQWNGLSHRSLSAIARAITGARWSGPRFFGLRGQE